LFTLETTIEKPIASPPYPPSHSFFPFFSWCGPSSSPPPWRGWPFIGWWFFSYAGSSRCVWNRHFYCSSASLTVRCLFSLAPAHKPDATGLPFDNFEVRVFPLRPTLGIFTTWLLLLEPFPFPSSGGPYRSRWIGRVSIAIFPGVLSVRAPSLLLPMSQTILLVFFFADFLLGLKMLCVLCLIFFLLTPHSPFYTAGPFRPLHSC